MFLGVMRHLNVSLVSMVHFPGCHMDLHMGDSSMCVWVLFVQENMCWVSLVLSAECDVCVRLLGVIVT